MTTKNSVEELEKLMTDVYPKVEKGKVQQQLERVGMLNLDEVMSAANEKFEDSIKEMFNTIKDLDTNLRHSIDLNIAFKKEAKTLQQELATNRGEVAALKDRLHKMEHSTPTIVDLELKMKLTLEEMDRLREDHEKERAALAAERELVAELNKGQEKLQAEYDQFKRESNTQRNALDKELSGSKKMVVRLEKDLQSTIKDSEKQIAALIKDRDTKVEKLTKERNEALEELAQSKEELVDLYKAINRDE